MVEYLFSDLEMFLKIGFLETRAPLYMDVLISFLAVLPIFIAISIMFAINKYFKVHKFTQVLLFLLTLLASAFFSYVVHYEKGFDALILQSSIDSRFAFSFLVIHAIIAISTIVLWFFTLRHAIEDRKRKALPGMYSVTHKKAGKRLFLGIFLSSLSAVVLYWILFAA